MDSAIDVETGLEVSAFHAIQTHGFICPHCSHPVFLKPGEVNVPHFSHHNDQVVCPDFHKGMGGSRFTRLISDYKNQLSDDAKRSAWNAIIRYFLDNELLDQVGLFPGIVFPIMNYLDTVKYETLERKRRLIEFLEGFSAISRARWDCDPNSLRRLHLDSDSDPTASSVESGTVSPQTDGRKTNARKVTRAEFSSLDELAKFNLVTKMLELAGGSEGPVRTGAEEFLAQVEFHPWDSTGNLFSIPFHVFTNSTSYIAVLSVLTRETIRDLIEETSVPPNHKKEIRTFYEATFGMPYRKR